MIYSLGGVRPEVCRSAPKFDPDQRFLDPLCLRPVLTPASCAPWWWGAASPCRPRCRMPNDWLWKARWYQRITADADRTDDLIADADQGATTAAARKQVTVATSQWPSCAASSRCGQDPRKEAGRTVSPTRSLRARRARVFIHMAMPPSGLRQQGRRTARACAPGGRRCID